MTHYRKKYIEYKREYLNLIGGKKCPSCDPFQLRLLSGVTFFKLFRNVFGRKILLLGEKHNRTAFDDDKYTDERGAYDVHTWLRDITLNKSENISLDLFVEEAYMSPLEYETLIRNTSTDPRVRYSGIESIDSLSQQPLNYFGAPVDAIRSIFSIYSTPDKKLDNMPTPVQNIKNFRYHYIDARLSISRGGIEYFIQLILDYGESIMSDYDPISRKQLFTYLIKDENNITGKTIMSEILDKLITKVMRPIYDDPKKIHSAIFLKKIFKYSKSIPSYKSAYSRENAEYQEITKRLFESKQEMENLSDLLDEKKGPAYVSRKFFVMYNGKFFDMYIRSLFTTDEEKLYSTQYSAYLISRDAKELDKIRQLLETDEFRKRINREAILSKMEETQSIIKKSDADGQKMGQRVANYDDVYIKFLYDLLRKETEDSTHAIDKWRNMIKKRYDKLDPTIPHEWSYIDVDGSKKNGDLLDLIIAEYARDSLNIGIHTLIIYQLDIYTLLRILTKFNVEKDAIKTNEFVTNAIVHTGENHSRMIASILTSMGFLADESTQTESNEVGIYTKIDPPFNFFA
jgi:hypothetical protein